MKKRLTLLILFVFFIFHSCLDYTLPDRIELELEGSLNLPVKTAFGDWGDMVRSVLEKSFSGGTEDIEIEVYNVNYEDQDAQAFCVYIPIIISESLNPDTHLGGLENNNALEINKDITIPFFDDFAFGCDINQGLSTFISGGKITVPIPITFSFDGSGTTGPDFLHAVIAEGDFIAGLDLSIGDVVLTEDNCTITYEIGIAQDDNTTVMGTCPGLDCPSNPSASPVQSLNGKKINGNPVKINGRITLTPKGGGITVDPSNTDLAGRLNITMDLRSFSDIFWNLERISGEMQTVSVSMAKAGENLNWIEFEAYKAENDAPSAGIGLNMEFYNLSDKLGLKMAVGCNELKFDGNEKKTLKQGDNIFGNKYALKGEDDRLTLSGNNAVDRLTFYFELFSDYAGNDKVLHIKDVKAGERLDIQGDAKFFQNWILAEVNLSKALKASLDDNGNLTGTFPKEGQEPIDLSLLGEYTYGFNFNDIAAYAYFSGPDDTIKQFTTSKLEISAQYGDVEPGDVKSLEILNTSPIILEKKHVVFITPEDSDDFEDNNGYNPDYLDEKGTYKIEGFPENGNETTNFDSLLNAGPKDLVFQYKMTDIPEGLPVTPEDFAEDADHNIVVTIIIFIKLDFVAGEEGAEISLPVLKDQHDLLSRTPDADDPSKPAGESVFTSLDIDRINISVDFSGVRFTNGKLFIEKDGDLMLFPEGKPVEGNTISIDINNNDYNFIKEHIITPDFRLKFDKGGKFVIPRKLGLTSVRIEGKGKNTVVLDLDK